MTLVGSENSRVPSVRFLPLGNGIAEAAKTDQEHCSVMLDVWSDFEKQRASP